MLNPYEMLATGIPVRHWVRPNSHGASLSIHTLLQGSHVSHRANDLVALEANKVNKLLVGFRTGINTDMPDGEK
jgi:hypothetical protein